RGGAARDGGFLTWANGGRGVLEGGGAAGGVAKGEVPCRDAPLDRRTVRHGPRVVGVGLRLENLRQPAHAGDAALGDADHPSDRDHGPEELELVPRERRQYAERERVADDGFPANEVGDGHG